MDDYKEKIERIKSFPIVEYANIIGFTPVPKGNKYFTLKEHDSVMIDPIKNCFWQNSTGAKGSIIDFSVNFENKDAATAIEDLEKLVPAGFIPSIIPRTASPKKEKTGLALPDKDNTYKNVYAYLIKARNIDPEIIADFVKSHRLYQDTNKNCVFVSYDNKGNADFACFRGTNQQHRFMGDIKGSNYDNCFFIDNKVQALVVTESVIDTMSYMTLIKQSGGDYTNYNYLALGGTQKHPAILNHLSPKIILALDNDPAGRAAAQEIKQSIPGDIKILEHLPNEKDWNEQLSRSVNKSHSINNIKKKDVGIDF